ncbi:hypothetical protein AQUCO_08300059v1 [Aquilegia coerulea]|uniref:F-box domain-containing protein n=1 Tax=Aquilegia coerulea TaxID=218851 RepID=A0A2G5C743_AQUCA|nr:hypothetical protein AQUCO_08300059v1 [Aquilegia coerulea]
MKRRCFLRNFPEEIMFDIFSRLPIRDVFQCELVCKHWYTNWTNFIYDNLNHSRIKQNQDGFNFLIQCCTKKGFIKLYLVDYENQDTSLKALNINFNLPSTKLKVVGSSNGLLCLCSLPDHETYYNICNPLTREVLQLPRACGLEKKFLCSPTPSGFEFDTTTNTIWRRVNDVPSRFFYPRKTMQVFVNGALHWRMSSQPDSEFYNCIGAIDIKSENFRAFKEPPNKEMVVVEQLRRRGPFKILRTMKQQSVLFHRDEDLGYYDVEKEEFKHVLIDGIPRYFEEFEAVVHLGSLISPRAIDGRSSAQKSAKTPKLL